MFKKTNRLLFATLVTVVAILGACNSQHHEKGDTLSLVKQSAARLERALNQDGVRLKWDSAVIANAEDPGVYGVKVPTSDGNTGIVAAVTDGEIVALSLVTRSAEDADAYVLDVFRGRIVRVKEAGEPSQVQTLDEDLAVQDLPWLSHTLDYVRSVQDPFASIDSYRLVQKTLHKGVEPLSCGPSDAPMYQRMLDAADDYEAASDAYDWAVRQAEAAAATAWYACAMCPETAVVCAGCAVALGTAGTLAAVAHHKGVLKRRAGDKVRNLARQVSIWVRDHCS